MVDARDRSHRATSRSRMPTPSVAPASTVLTPDEMVADLKERGPYAFALFPSHDGGIPPELAWESLHLFGARGAAPPVATRTEEPSAGRPCRPGDPPTPAPSGERDDRPDHLARLHGRERFVDLIDRRPPGDHSPRGRGRPARPQPDQPVEVTPDVGRPVELPTRVFSLKNSSNALNSSMSS